MKEIMIKIIKEDITYMLQELGNIRKQQCTKDASFRDFKPYRSMVDTLINTYDNLNTMYNYNIYKKDGSYVEYFISALFIKSERVHELMEACKGEHSQYRCLSDVYTKLTNKICKIENERPISYGTK